ncbi:hypothetical protein ACN2WE_21470 [Streptomyces sp. cg28]|uniref:hypothetical protein n=1 Tax=Streptomyces sp. cg28 TaxID=3403457 RepID=UPI003B228EE6
MARIRVLRSIAGADFVWEPGQVVDLPGDQAAAWADGVRAELVRGQTPETPETAAAETTARKPARRRKTPTT